MWEKIVLNLLSNAFKFTFEGRSACEVGAGRRRSLGWRCATPGSASRSNTLPRIFERFHRVKARTAARTRGPASAWHWCRSWRRLHGGAVAAAASRGREGARRSRWTFRQGDAHLPPDGSVTPTPPTGVGATTVVEERRRWLPRSRAAPAEQAPLPEHRPRGLHASCGCSSPTTTLTCACTPRRLLAEQYAVEVAGDGQEAAGRARASEARPGGQRRDDARPRRLRARPRAARGSRTMTLSGVLLSARAGEESRVEGVSHGADDYVVKPFTARELVARSVRNCNSLVSVESTRRRCARATRGSAASRGLGASVCSSGTRRGIRPSGVPSIATSSDSSPGRRCRGSGGSRGCILRTGSG